MKRTLLLIVIVLFFASCIKFPGPLPAARRPVDTANFSFETGTMPDNAAFRLKLVKDSANADETLFVFRHTATAKYSLDDAACLPGFGQVSLASVSSEGKDLSVNCMPYIPGAPIGLDVRTKAGGMYLFKTSFEKQIPVYIQVWLVDTYLKDSIDVRRRDYSFTVSKSDAGSSDNKRFKLILRKSTQQQTAQPH